MAALVLMLITVTDFSVYSGEKSVLEFGGSISRLHRKGMPAVTGENYGNASISKRWIDKLAVGRVVTWLKLAMGETD